MDKLDPPISEHLQLTPAAARCIYSQIQAAGEGKKIRLFVVGGGCAGLQYGFILEDSQLEDDIVMTKPALIEEQGVFVEKVIQFVCDPFSFIYLADATIDFVETPEKTQFVVHNTKVNTRCACGRTAQHVEHDE
jgi:iron-sulfur cluster insertion protein